MKLLNFVKKNILLPLFFFFCISGQASADDPWKKYVDNAPVKTVSDLMLIITNILKYMQYFLYSGAAIVSMIAAYNYLTSKGEMEKTKTAQNTILYAVIAVVVGLIAGGAGLILDSMFGH